MARILVLDTLKHPSNTGTANITLSSDETTTMPAVNINGGQIDSTTVGASTPSSVAATTLTASGNATAGGTLGVTGNTTIGGTLGVTGAATLSSTAAITGNTTVGGTLGVTGATTLSSTAAITGNTTVGGTLAVTGAITGSNFTATTINGIEMRYYTQWLGGLQPTNYSLGIGAGSLDSLQSSNIGGAEGNTGFGVNTLTANLQGQYCTAVGYGALDSVVGTWNSASGDYNTAIGKDAGGDITYGHNNIMIGYRSGTSNAPSGSVTEGDYIVCLGDNNTSSFYCADDSISTSDGRDKTDVEDFTAGLEWIEAMRPVTFHWDKRSWYTEYDEETGEVTSQPDPDGTHKRDKKNLGFIGQEVLAIEQAHGFANNKNDMLTVNLNEDDTAYGMKYARLVPVLVNAIKELSQSNKELSTRITTLETA